MCQGTKLIALEGERKAALNQDKTILTIFKDPRKENPHCFAACAVHAIEDINTDAQADTGCTREEFATRLSLSDSRKALIQSYFRLVRRIFSHETRKKGEGFK